MYVTMVSADDTHHVLKVDEHITIDELDQKPTLCEQRVDITTWALAIVPRLTVHMCGKCLAVLTSYD